MPIIDRDKEGDGRRVVKVSKKGLDPFAKKQQAIREARRSTALPLGPNTQDIEFDIADRGDHFEVAIQAKRSRAGPGGVAGAVGRIGGFRDEPREKEPRGPSPEFKARAAGSEFSLGAEPESGMLSVDSPTQRADDDTGRARDSKRKERAGGSGDALQMRVNSLSAASADTGGQRGGTPAGILGGSFDLQSQLDTLYSAPELRDRARRAGVYTSNTMDKRRIIEAIERQDPVLARRLAGR
jgi:hypothetical protein